MKWKIAICGLGAATGQIHIPAYQKLSSVEVVAGYDPAIGAVKYSFPLFDSFDEMISTAKPDIVVIATPTTSHLTLRIENPRAGGSIPPLATI